MGGLGRRRRQAEAPGLWDQALTHWRSRPRSFQPPLRCSCSCPVRPLVTTAPVPPPRSWTRVRRVCPAPRAPSGHSVAARLCLLLSARCAVLCRAPLCCALVPAVSRPLLSALVPGRRCRLCRGCTGKGAGAATTATSRPPRIPCTLR